MYKFNRPILGLLLFLGSCNAAFSQEDEKKQKVPISLAITNHSWSFPFSQVFRLNPFHPGLEAGTEWCYKEKEKFKFYQAADIGGFINRSSGSAIYMNLNLGIRAKFKFGLRADFAFGLGYFHGFHPSFIYTQSIDGTYQQSKDKGVGSLAANFKMGLGFELPESNRELTLFGAYQWMVSTSYWSLITIRPNGLLHIGVKANLFKSYKS